MPAAAHHQPEKNEGKEDDSDDDDYNEGDVHAERIALRTKHLDAFVVEKRLLGFLHVAEPPDTTLVLPRLVFYEVRLHLVASLPVRPGGGSLQCGVSVCRTSVTLAVQTVAL